MSLSGPDALRSLEEALRDIRREEDEIAKRLARSAELVTKIRATEGELFRQLAKVRLDPAMQAELSGRLSGAEVSAREQLKQHSVATGEAEAKLKTLDTRIAELGGERTAKLGEVAKRQDELQAIADSLKGKNGADPVHAKAVADAAELEHVATESRSKLEQAEKDREEKGRPYRDDPLFMYLWERGYGTSAYKANNLVAWLDSLVARKAAYHKARPNYAMLIEIPQRLKEHAERQLANAETARQALVAIETAAIDAVGGKPIREALEAAQTRIATIDEAVVAAEDERDDAVKAQRELAEGGDPKFSAAISALGEALGREDLKALLDEARQTRSAQDDTIIQQIDDARQRAVEEESETKDQKSRLKVLADRRRELEDIQFEFKKSRYDDPRSSFREDKLVGDVLTDFLRGGITAGNYWDQWKRSQNWTGGYQPGPWDGYTPRKYDDDQPKIDERELWRQEEQQRDGAFSFPDSSFGGSSDRSRRNKPGGFGGSWGSFPGTGRGNSGGFSRPRGGGFSTGGGFKSGGGFKTGGGF
jgi:hypothetical protein